MGGVGGTAGAVGVLLCGRGGGAGVERRGDAGVNLAGPGRANGEGFVRDACTRLDRGGAAGG